MTDTPTPGKRASENVITIGSGEAYIAEFTGTVPSHSTLCVTGNRLAYIKGGATLTYTKETVEVQDDLGKVKKTFLSKDGATLKLGLCSWVGTTLKKLCSTARVTESTDGLTRTVKIGGVANDDGKSYAVCFHHHDAADGDVWITVVGKNTEDLTLAFATDEMTTVDPVFTAEPSDSDGTLIIYEEEIAVATTAG